MKKSFLILIIPFILIFAGCTAWEKSNENLENLQSENLNQNETVQEVEIEEEYENSNLNEEINEEVVDETADWLTYENEEYEFNFKYPLSFTLEILNEGGPASDVGDVYISNENNTCFIHITKPTTEKKEVIEYSINNGILKNSQIPIESININNLKGIKYNNVVNSNGEEGAIYELIINEKGFSFLIRSGNADKECLNISEKILNTIKTIP